MPIGETAQLWSDENYFDRWQDGFESIELIEGQKNMPGARSRILLGQGKNSMELIETIILNNLPEEKKALYEHIHMTNTQTTRFVKKSPDITEFISEVEYLKFNGLMPKILSILFPGMFKKQSQKWMDQFKTFAETQK